MGRGGEVARYMPAGLPLPELVDTGLLPCPLACPGSIDSKSADRLRGAGARLGDGVPVVGGLRPPKAAFVR